MQAANVLDRSQWWSTAATFDTTNGTAIVADSVIPAHTFSPPINSCPNLRSVLYELPIRSVVKVTVDQTTGKMIGIGRTMNWISYMRIADNCEDKNIEVDFDVFSRNSLVLQSMRTINIGEELKAWPSNAVLAHLEIPYLTPSNIINDENYRCTQCGASFNQPNPLKIHIAFACSNIEKMTATPSVSPSIPSSFSPTNCPLTPTRSDSTSSPRIEKRTPTKEPKTHICVFCGKLYTRKYGLKIHLRTHTGHKPLQCRFCGRPFSDPSNLNKHIRLHAHHGMHFSSSPYKCNVCGKIMIRRRDLDRHIKSRHE